MTDPFIILSLTFLSWQINQLIITDIAPPKKPPDAPEAPAPERAIVPSKISSKTNALTSDLASYW